LDGIETKFYCLERYNIIASVSVFSIEVSKGKGEVFSFILVLPMSEMSEFLPRHPVCESKVQRLLRDYLVTPLKEKVRDVPYKNIVCKSLGRSFIVIFCV